MPPQFPDLFPFDVFVCGHLNNRIYSTKGTSLQNLKKQIINECLAKKWTVIPSSTYRYSKYIAIEIPTWGIYPTLGPGIPLPASPGFPPKT